MRVGKSYDWGYSMAGRGLWLGLGLGRAGRAMIGIRVRKGYMFGSRKAMIWVRARAMFRPSNPDSNPNANPVARKQERM